VLLYLVTVVPAIWFLELDLMEARVMTSRPHDVIASQLSPAGSGSGSDEDAISSVLNDVEVSYQRSNLVFTIFKNQIFNLICRGKGKEQVGWKPFVVLVVVSWCLYFQHIIIDII
jgi:hypothetical protein